MAENKQKIMIVDDDKNIAQLIRLLLEKQGYAVTTCENGSEALRLFESTKPDLLILDIMLPGMDGWEVCRSVRQQSATPIIMLSAKDETFDKVLGLELGADDYITKPFDNKELVARVKAVLRRTATKENDAQETITFPGLSVSLETYQVHFRGQLLEMPPKELELL